MVRKIVLIVLGAIVGILAFASPVSAAGFLPDFLNPGKMMAEAIADFFNQIASDFASTAFELLADYVIAITDISKIPSIDTFMNWSKWAGGSIATMFFIKRLAEALRDELTGESTSNISEILGSFVIGMVLVFATPYLILNYMIPINNQVVQAVGGLGIDVTVYEDAKDIFFGDSEGLDMLFLFLVWALCFTAFSISGAIRYVDLAIVLIMGSLVATSYVNRSQVYGTYWTEVVSVVFTQSIHIVLAYFVIQWSSDGTLLGMMFAVAGCIAALRGPQVLRQFLYNSGTGGMMQGAGRFTAYKVMMKGVGK